MPTRPATPDDVRAIVRVVNRAYRVEDRFAIGDRTDEDDVRDRLAKPNGSFLVVDDGGGELAGAIFVEVRGARGYFGPLAVDPAHQRRGLGRVLVEAAEERCRDAGCHFLDLDILDLRPELVPFYVGLGFAAYDKVPYPHPEAFREPAHLVLMTKPLVEL